MPHNYDERLAAMFVADANFDPIPVGAVGLGWLSTTYFDATVVEMRGHPLAGVSVSGSGESVSSRERWVPLGDMSVAVIVEYGETIEVRLEATVTDHLKEQEYEDDKLILQPLEFALSVSGIRAPASLDCRGPSTAKASEHTMYAEWLFRPWPEVFLFQDPAQRGVLWFELSARGRSADISDLRMILRVRPAERQPGS
jgi:hypothetical protein